MQVKSERVFCLAGGCYDRIAIAFGDTLSAVVAAASLFSP